MPTPAWYCPPGVERPPHCPHLAPVQLLPGVGPDAAAGGDGGGRVYGGCYDPDTAEQWQLTTGGWWVLLRGAHPRDLRRADAAPGIVALGWLVPQILRGESPAIGYWDANGYQVPRRWKPYVEALVALLDERGPITPAIADLAARLIGENHHVSIHELGAWGILTDDLVRLVLAAASGVPPEIALQQLAQGTA